VNGQSAKPNRIVRPGDQIAITRPLGRTVRVVVRTLSSKHVPKAEARLMYEDMTPAPSPEEIEKRRLERIFRATMSPPRAPDKRERRALRRLRGRDD
jgi:ribosome-associated heat shock protein Hsp15